MISNAVEVLRTPKKNAPRLRRFPSANICIGVESFLKEDLRLYNKGLHARKNIEVLEMLRRRDFTAERGIAVPS